MIEFKHLRLLQAVEQHGTLSGAARQLGFSQPAVTQQMQSLENLLGTPLIIRSRTGTRLTDAGKILLKHGKAALTAISLAEAEVSAVTGLRAGEVRIASFPSAASTIVPAALEQIKNRHPGLSLTLLEAEPPEALQQIRAGECDIAIVFQWSNAERMDGDDLAWLPLVQEDVHLIVSAEDPPAGLGEVVALEDLWGAKWIAGCTRCRTHLMQSCEAAGFSPDIAFEVDDYVAMQSLASRGLGVAMIPDLMLASVRVAGLELRRISPPTYRSVLAVTTPELERVPAVRAALQALRAAGKEISSAAAVRNDGLNITVSALPRHTNGDVHPVIHKLS